MRKKDLQQQIQMLLSKCENLSADLASAKSVSDHYKKEIEQLKNQLEQATELISDLSAQLEAAQSALPQPTVAQDTPAELVQPSQLTEEVAEAAQSTPAEETPAPLKVAVPNITAGEEPGLDYGAKAIGDAVFACTKFCNSATGELQRDLVHLALGRTEVFKGTVLSILEGEGDDAKKQQEITNALAEVLEYFEGLKQQEA